MKEDVCRGGGGRHRRENLEKGGGGEGQLQFGNIITKEGRTALFSWRFSFWNLLGRLSGSNDLLDVTLVPEDGKHEKLTEWSWQPPSHQEILKNRRNFILAQSLILTSDNNICILCDLVGKPVTIFTLTFIMSRTVKKRQVLSLKILWPPDDRSKKSAVLSLVHQRMIGIGKDEDLPTGWISWRQQDGWNSRLNRAGNFFWRSSYHLNVDIFQQTIIMTKDKFSKLFAIDLKSSFKWLRAYKKIVTTLPTWNLVLLSPS